MAALGLSALLSGTGCSLLFVDGPPKTYVPSWKLQCSETYVWPVVDLLLASYQVLRTVNAFSAPDAAYRGAALSRGSDVAAGISLTLLTSISSGFGFARVSDCRAVKGSDVAPPPRPRFYPRQRYDPVGGGAATPAPAGPTQGAAPAPAAPAPTAPAPAAPAPPVAPVRPVRQQADWE